MLFLLGARTAGGQSMAGRWTGRIDGDIQRVGDSSFVRRRDDMIIDLRANGDSLVGTIQQAGRPIDVRGRFDGARLELRADAPEAGFYVNGAMVRDTIHRVWHATIAGQELRGTLTTRPGDPARPFRWEARRQ